MIALLLVASFLFALGAWSVVGLSTRVLHRLGIDPTGAALWLGLAELPPEEAPAPRPRPRVPARAPRAPQRPAPTRPSRAAAPPPAPRRPRQVVEWGEGPDFAFATRPPARARR